MSLLRGDQITTTQKATTAWKVHQRAATKAGDTVVAAFASYYTSTDPTPPDGTWTALGSLSRASSAYLAVFTKTATADGAADHIFTGASRSYAGWCGAVAGSGPAAPATANNYGTTATAPPVTPGTAGSLLLTLATCIRAAAPPLAPTGTKWRRRANTASGDSGGLDACLAVYAIDDAPASAPPALTFAMVGNQHWVAETLLFTPNAQPPARTADILTPSAGAWVPRPDPVSVSGAWV